jgi:hypothetical protein
LRLYLLYLLDLLLLRRQRDLGLWLRRSLLDLLGRLLLDFALLHRRCVGCTIRMVITVTIMGPWSWPEGSYPSSRTLRLLANRRRP